MEAIEFDIAEVGSALKLSHKKAFGREPDDRTLEETRALVIDKPIMMPTYLREWLRSLNLGYENDTISWLKQYV